MKWYCYIWQFVKTVLMFLSYNLRHFLRWFESKIDYSEMIIICSDSWSLDHSVALLVSHGVKDIQGGFETYADDNCNVFSNPEKKEKFGKGMELFVKYFSGLWD